MTPHEFTIYFFLSSLVSLLYDDCNDNLATSVLCVLVLRTRCLSMLCPFPCECISHTDTWLTTWKSKHSSFIGLLYIFFNVTSIHFSSPASEAVLPAHFFNVYRLVSSPFSWIGHIFLPLTSPSRDCAAWALLCCPVVVVFCIIVLMPFFMAICLHVSHCISGPQ